MWYGSGTSLHSPFSPLSHTLSLSPLPYPPFSPNVWTKPENWRLIIIIDRNGYFVACFICGRGWGKKTRRNHLNIGGQNWWPFATALSINIGWRTEALTTMEMFLISPISVSRSQSTAFSFCLARWLQTTNDTSHHPYTEFTIHIRNSNGSISVHCAFICCETRLRSKCSGSFIIGSPCDGQCEFISLSLSL